MTIRSSSCNKSKILVFGSTGYFGKHVVRASMLFGHPTFVFVRPANPQMPPSNLRLRDEFRSLGNELISLREKKMGQSFEKVRMQADEVVKLSQTLPSPDNLAVSIIHSVFMKGDLTSFDLDEDDLEDSSLYPEIEYTTVDQLFDMFLVDPPEPVSAALE